MENWQYNYDKTVMTPPEPKASDLRCCDCGENLQYNEFYYDICGDIYCERCAEEWFEQCRHEVNDYGD